MNYFTALMTERVIEDGFWLVVLAAVLAFFWFHRQGKRQGRQSELEVMKLNRGVSRPTFRRRLGNGCANK